MSNVGLVLWKTSIVPPSISVLPHKKIAFTFCLPTFFRNGCSLNSTDFGQHQVSLLPLRSRARDLDFSNSEVCQGKGRVSLLTSFTGDGVSCHFSQIWIIWRPQHNSSTTPTKLLSHTNCGTVKMAQKKILQRGTLTHEHEHPDAPPRSWCLPISGK